MPESPDSEGSLQYSRVARAIRYLQSHARRQPSLAEVAAEVGLSEYHFQRLFSRWAGVSPKRFLQYLTKERARQVLQESQSLLDASLEAGLSGPGRLHDLMISCEAMTPGQIKARGAGLEIGYGWSESPFGMALIGWTPHGICHLAFHDEPESRFEEELAGFWPEARLRQDATQAGRLTAQIFPRQPRPGTLHLVLRGTNFQIKVWEALLRVAAGELVSYSRLAALAGSPGAARAVGSALAGNRIGYLIPCHRVIRETGEPGQYRWGSERKLIMQGWEAAHRDALHSLSDFSR
ncbi:methylated-DNA--[protein]-cysteine S-methyltransferase [Sedimenticola sp.]|uniref:methylated-DNA--[protein]-cysteine S-methyltransferase n=1 Tax=Sedimenticola sp. TaxID=1940285 RepID=UPI003D0EFB17